MANPGCIALDCLVAEGLGRGRGFGAAPAPELLLTSQQEQRIWEDIITESVADQPCSR